MPEPPEAASAQAVIICIECDRPWVDDQERWRLKLTDDDPPVAVAYCPACAFREFDLY